MPPHTCTVTQHSAPPPLLRRSTACLLVALVALLGCAGSDGAVGPATTVTVTVTGVALSGIPDTLAIWEIATATATATLSTGGSRTVTSGWTATPSSVVVLTPGGSGVSIKALGSGTVTITATDEGQSASKTVLVLAVRFQSLAALVSDTLRVGRVVPLVIRGVQGDGTALTVLDASISTSDNGIIAVSGNTITAVAPGTADVIIVAGGLRVVRRMVIEPPPVVIDLQVMGPMSATLRAALQAAVTRWQDVFATGWAWSTVTVPANYCSAGEPALTNATITGVRVYVLIDDKLLAGGLARGGPCYSVAGRTVIGRIYLSSGVEGKPSATMRAILKHELGHVLGFPADALSTGAPGPDPRFVGAEARRQFVLAGGTDAGGVPLETGAVVGAASAYTHWRLSSMPGELMTAYAGQSVERPDGGALSAITLGLLVDIGYPIRMSSADPYRVSGAFYARVPTVVARTGGPATR